MRKILILLFLFFSGSEFMIASKSTEVDCRDKLAVIWSSGDPDVAMKVCFMYTHAAKRMEWFKEVILIVWGPSAKLLSENEELQKKVAQMKADGVILKACVNCANMCGVSDNLRNQGIEVKGMGKELTEMLKNDWRQLNF